MLHHLTSSFLIFLLTVSKPVDQQAPLPVHILNVQKNSGQVVVEIYKSKADWLQKPFRRMTLPADDNTKKVFFDVPHGKYAISIYQDTNENGRLDQNILGIPKEPIGFGNNYKPFGKPSFESALVAYSPSSTPQAIKLFNVL